jgi:hypothetical protein
VFGVRTSDSHNEKQIQELKACRSIDFDVQLETRNWWGMDYAYIWHL